jgi:hypothetical protein
LGGQWQGHGWREENGDEDEEVVREQHLESFWS